MPYIIDQNTEVRLKNIDGVFKIAHVDGRNASTYIREKGWNIYNLNREELLSLPLNGTYKLLNFKPKDNGSLKIFAKSINGNISADFSLSKSSGNNGIVNRLSSVKGLLNEQLIMKWINNDLEIALDNNIGSGTIDLRLQIIGEEI